MRVQYKCADRPSRNWRETVGQKLIDHWQQARNARLTIIPQGG